MDWRHNAVCREEDPELFFPIGNTGPALLQIEAAKTVCRRCPVIEQCLQWALASGQYSGVWGGLSEDERRAMKRRAARNRARQASAWPTTPADSLSLAARTARTHLPPPSRSAQLSTGLGPHRGPGLFAVLPRHRRRHRAP